jgi:hypothetical protein
MGQKNNSLKGSARQPLCNADFSKAAFQKTEVNLIIQQLQE